MPAVTPAVSHATYRHGDLLEPGIGLMRSGGPDAVVLREATRHAGVAPNAAYRHFNSLQALLQAVRGAALTAVAEAMLAALEPHLLSTGYLRFAQAETGLFHTAFAALGQLQPDAPTPATTGPYPFELLSFALNRLVKAGMMTPERCPGAEFLAWSAVHGLAMLVIDGLLGQVIGPQMQQVGQRLLDMMEKGL